MFEGDGLLGASGKARKAADTVGVAHKGLVGHIDIHRASACALVAMNAGGFISANANQTQDAKETAPCPPGTGVIAEGPFEEETDEKRCSQHTPCSGANRVATQQLAHVPRTLQPIEGNFERYQ